VAGEAVKRTTWVKVVPAAKVGAGPLAGADLEEFVRTKAADIKKVLQGTETGEGGPESKVHYC